MGTTSLTPKSAYREETRLAGFGLSEIFMVILAIRARETPRGSPPKQAGDPKHQKLQYRPQGTVGPTSFRQKKDPASVGKELDQGSGPAATSAASVRPRRGGTRSERSEFRGSVLTRR